MGRLRRPVWILVFLGMVTAFAAHAEEALLDGVAAHVNEHVITVSDTMANAQPAFFRLRQRYNGRELRHKMGQAYEAALEALVDRYLILDSFEKEGGEIPDPVIEQRVEEVIREKFGGDRLKLMETLSGAGLSYDKWRVEIRDSFVVSSLQHRQVSQNVKVSPVQVRREYNTNVDRYMSSPQVRLYMIILREGESTVTADAVKKRLEEEAFAEVAKEVSVDRKAKDGGDWGWLSLGDLRFELSEAITAARESDAAGNVLQIPGEKDTYIFKVDGWKAGTRISFQDSQPRIEKELRMKEEQRLYDAWIAGLKSEAYVKVFDVDVF